MDYKVPQGGELLPLTVRASIDGSGAAVPFYAVVQVISPSGRVMGSYITTSIAAGASADVTWFPGVRLSGGTSTPNLNVYHGGVLIGTEPGVDIVDSSSVSWTVTDVPASGWVLLSAAATGTSTTGQAPGSYTWTNPGTGTVNVICVGAGGGGGGGNNTGAAGGGGGGGCVNIWSGNAALLPGTVGYTVGAGGAGAATDGDGGNGGSSFFGSPAIVFAGGGGGGGGTGAGTNAGKGGGGGGSISSASLSSPGSPFPVGNTNTTTDSTGYQGAWGVDGHHKGNVAEWGGASGAGASDVAATPVGAGGSLHGGPGGGGGGTPAGGDINGSPGGGHDYTTGSGGANGRPGAAGSSTPAPYTGTGGGGGNYLAAGNGASGGAGGPGAGGGGSSGFDAGKTSGSGGNGGNGAVYIFVT